LTVFALLVKLRLVITQKLGVGDKMGEFQGWRQSKRWTKDGLKGTRSFAPTFRWRSRASASALRSSSSCLRR
jgi:hypothetical protein